MKPKRAPVVKRVVVDVPAFDLLSRKIKRAATEKAGEPREIADRLLAAALRETPDRARSPEQKRLLDDLRDGKLQSKGGRPRDDETTTMVCRVFDGLCAAFPHMQERAIIRLLSTLDWPLYSEDVTLPDDKEARAAALRAPETRYRTFGFENLKRIVKRRRASGSTVHSRHVGTKPV